jgi:Fe-S cluster biogenesis protein NfuA
MAGPDLRAVGDRIERLLEQLRSSLDGRAWDGVEEVVGLVTELYGGGLARVLELARDEPALLERMADDELVASLLVLHGLHPLGLDDRIRQALDSVRPYLGSHGGDVEVVAVDGAEGVLRLRMVGSCDGCPSSAVTLELAVRRAIEEAAPEITRIDVEGAVPSPVAPSPVAGAGDGAVSQPVRLGRKPSTVRAGR